MKNIFIIAFFLLSSMVKAQTGANTLTISFDGIKADTGKLFVALYNTEADFLKKPIQGTIIDVHKGKAKAVFNNLKQGIYAVSSFFDKNNNGELDTNFLGIPKEPTGMSNDAKGSFGPPKFKDAKFGITTSEMHIKINY